MDAEPLKAFWKQCDKGLEDHAEIRDMVVAGCSSSCTESSQEEICRSAWSMKLPPPTMERHVATQTKLTVHALSLSALGDAQ